MINKEKFLHYIKTLREYHEFDSKLYECTNGSFNLLELDPLSNLYSDFISMLNYCLEQKEDIKDNRGYPIPNDLEYFIYDVEFGKQADKYYMTDAEGVEHHWHNPEEFYDYLTSCNKEEEKND